MDKRVSVVSGDLINDIVIRPGTTTQEIVQQLNLPSDYQLSKRDGAFLRDSEEVYGLVREGEKLFASAEPNVGRRRAA